MSPRKDRDGAAWVVWEAGAHGRLRVSHWVKQPQHPLGPELRALERRVSGQPCLCPVPTPCRGHRGPVPP